MIYNYHLFCPKCNANLLLTQYADNSCRFEGECPNCETYYDIRLEETHQ